MSLNFTFQPIEKWFFSRKFSLEHFQWRKDSKDIADRHSTLSRQTKRMCVFLGCLTAKLLDAPHATQVDSSVRWNRSNRAANCLRASCRYLITVSNGQCNQTAIRIAYCPRFGPRYFSQCTRLFSLRRTVRCWFLQRNPNSDTVWSALKRSPRNRFLLSSQTIQFAISILVEHTEIAGFVLNGPMRRAPRWFLSMTIISCQNVKVVTLLSMVGAFCAIQDRTCTWSFKCRALEQQSAVRPVYMVKFWILQNSTAIDTIVTIPTVHSPA